MGRKILFITTDQQRYDTLGVNGGALREPRSLDRLAARAIRYERCQPTSVVCMPSRASMLTGQYPSTHGAWMNGVALAMDAPSVAESLHDLGYATALIGKAHFEPFMDPFGRFARTRWRASGYRRWNSPGTTGVEGCTAASTTSSLRPTASWGRCTTPSGCSENHPEALAGFYPVVDGDLNVNAAGGGDTGAAQVKFNDVPREWYHTDWVADRTIEWLDGQRPTTRTGSVG